MAGAGEMLDLIRSGRGTTRGELQEITGLSRMTVAARVDALLGAGLVIERGSGGATGGRRARRLEFHTGHASVLAATVDTHRTTLAVTDLAGRISHREVLDVAVADGPARTLPALVDASRRLLDHAGVAPGRVCGLGLSVPGPVDPTSGRPSQPPIMPGWDGYPVPEHLSDALGVPVVVANDADAAALGEQVSGVPRSDALVYVKVSTGIGTGIVVGGRVYRGIDGGAGDIGHVRLPGHEDALCQCGSYGCLAAVASGRAVAASLRELGRDATSGADVGALLAAGDGDAARLTQQAGRVIGEVMATVVCLLNPGELVIGGALASAPLLAGVRETLYPRSLPRATRHLTVHLTHVGDDAAVVGLAAMVVAERFSAEAVDAAL